MDNSMVSIVMPVYMVEQYIEYSLKSVIRQSYKNIELIIVDDGTRDRSIEIAVNILKDSDIEYTVIIQENAGLGSARNTGLRKARGDWVFFLDSDDTIADQAIELLHNATSDDIDLVFSNYKKVYCHEEIDCIDKTNKVIALSNDDLQYAFLMRKAIILAPGTLYRKRFLLNNNLTFSNMPWSEDQHFIWRVISCANAAVFIDNYLYYYLIHQNSIMTTPQKEKIEVSYYEIRQLPLTYNFIDAVKEFLVPRWVLGSLHSVAKVGDYEIWKNVINVLDYKVNIHSLIKFPNIYIKILAIIGSISHKALFYILNKL